MSKIAKCQMLHSRLVSRFRAEHPSMVISDRISGWIYQAICDIYEKDGEEEAERYVREAKML